MDWSKLYDDAASAGSEEDLDVQGGGSSSYLYVPVVTSAGRLGDAIIQRRRDRAQSGDAKEIYTPFAAFILTLNYILGVGCLGVPYAFERAGVLLSAGILIFTSALSFVTVMWVSETVARAQALAQLPCEKHSIRWKCLKAHSRPASSHWQIVRDTRSRVVLSPRLEDNNKSRPLLLSDVVRDVVASELRCDECMDAAIRTASSPGSSSSAKKSYEVTELAYKFIGPFGKYGYQLSLAILMYAGLLAYAQVFVSSVLLMIPSEYHYSWMDAVIASVFAVLVVPLSTMELTEQVFVQTVMALTMQVSIGVIVASCVVAIYMDPSDGDRDVESDDGPPYVADSVRFADFSNFGLMLSTSLFSQLFQHSVPGLIRPLSVRNRKGPVVRKIFGSALLLTTLMYVLLGLVATLYVVFERERDIISITSLTSTRNTGTLEIRFRVRSI